jgi:hypothetical protein
MLFMEIIDVYREIHTEHIIQNARVEAGGTYSYHWTFLEINPLGD